MDEPARTDPDRQLDELCRVLNYFGVRYVVFGSHVARVNGIPVETVDVDVVPDVERANLERLAEALNMLGPRWRVEGVEGGMRIDGRLEARHFLGESTAIGLLTRLGPVDVVLAPAGYAEGYQALEPSATTVRRGDVEIRVGAIEDVVRSKELLRRDKDLEHLALLYEQRPDLAPAGPDEHGLDPDEGLDLGP